MAKRDAWGPAAWCAYVEQGRSRAERAGRLAEVPAAWRAAVESHVRVTFQIRAAAKRQRESQGR